MTTARLHRGQIENTGPKRYKPTDDPFTPKALHNLAQGRAAHPGWGYGVRGAAGNTTRKPPL
jgi:hypothetical protein